jgi:uncharacterized membrane protein
MTQATDESSAPDQSTVPPVARRRRFRPGWGTHPAVPTGEELTLGERAADAMRNGMGSWGFVFGALAFLACWMLYNRNVGFDKYPFILLNLVLSCLAAMQGAILLIAAKRSDQIDSLLAQHDYATNVDAEQEIHKVHSRIIELEERIVDLMTSNGELLAQNAGLLDRLVAAAPGTAERPDPPRSGPLG